MSQITWIIEDCFSSDTELLLEEVKRLGDNLVIIGCLSCAGLYDCNRKEVVRAIRETLLREDV